MKRYIAFYDSSCGLCNRSVQAFLRLDKGGKVLFAPLGGTTAQTALVPWKARYAELNSFILLEEDTYSGYVQVYFWSRAVFRALFILGGLWRLLGLLSFLPQWMLYPFDCLYCFIARRRRSFCSYTPNKSFYKDRFLP